MSPPLPPQSRLLLDALQIRAHVKAQASQIDHLYQASDLVLVGVLKGAVHYISDLLRSLTLDPQMEWVRVETYSAGTTNAGQSRLVFVGDVKLEGRDVLVVDDILDRGHTYRLLSRELMARNPASLRWAFLLEKEGARHRAGFDPDFAGLLVPEVWVVGYGMDLSEKYRNLEGIYAL